MRLNELLLLGAIIAVVCLTAVLDSNHSYYAYPVQSLEQIVRQVSILGIYGLGAALVIIAGGIDLSAGSVIAFSGVIAASTMQLLNPVAMNDQLETVGIGVVIASVVVAIFSGVVIGSTHAWMINQVGLPPFIATLATLVGIRSLAWAICEFVTESFGSGKSTQMQMSDVYIRELSNNVWLPAITFLFLAAIFWFLLSRTVLGRHIYALGGNEQAARLSGIRVENVKWVVYCLSALTAAIAGIFVVADESAAFPERQGRGYELFAIAAAVVGGCSLQGGSGTIPGAVLGAIFLRVVMDGIARVVKTNATVYEGMIVGVVVVLAVAFSQLQKDTRARRPLFEGVQGAVSLASLSILAFFTFAVPFGIQVSLVLSVIFAAVCIGLATFQARKQVR